MCRTIGIVAILGTAVLLGAAAFASQHVGGHAPPAGVPPHGAGHAPPFDCPLGGPGPGPCGGLIGLIHEILDGMSLSDEQREAVHETLMSRRVEIGSVVRPVIEAQRALRAAILADAVDEAEIRTAAGAVGTSLADASVAFAKLRVEALASAQLTPAQVEKLSEVRTRRDEAFRKILEEHLPALIDGHAER
jgi:Spy/CpxP family protein refolding chaperone